MWFRSTEHCIVCRTSLKSGDSCLYLVLPVFFYLRICKACESMKIAAHPLLWRTADIFRLGLSVLMVLVSAVCISFLVGAVVYGFALPGTLFIHAHPSAERYVMVVYLVLLGLLFLGYRIWRKKHKTVNNSIQSTGLTPRG